MTWGTPDSGGSQPRDVQQIQATADAFAAIRGDGSVAGSWSTIL